MPVPCCFLHKAAFPHRWCERIAAFPSWRPVPRPIWGTWKLVRGWQAAWHDMRDMGDTAWLKKAGKWLMNMAGNQWNLMKVDDFDQRCARKLERNWWNATRLVPRKWLKLCCDGRQLGEQRQLQVDSSWKGHVAWNQGFYMFFPTIHKEFGVSHGFPVNVRSVACGCDLNGSGQVWSNAFACWTTLLELLTFIFSCWILTWMWQAGSFRAPRSQTQRICTIQPVGSPVFFAQLLSFFLRRLSRVFRVRAHRLWP